VYLVSTHTFLARTHQEDGADFLQDIPIETLIEYKGLAIDDKKRYMYIKYDGRTIKRNMRKRADTRNIQELTLKELTSLKDN